MVSQQLLYMQTTMQGLAICIANAFVHATSHSLSIINHTAELAEQAWHHQYLHTTQQHPVLILPSSPQPNKGVEQHPNSITTPFVHHQSNTVHCWAQVKSTCTGPSALHQQTSIASIAHNCPPEDVQYAPQSPCQDCSLQLAGHELKHLR